MHEYFGIHFEFSKSEVESEITELVRNDSKVYICVVDSNVLAMSYRNEQYKAIVNSSVMNICDGSSIAFLAGLIHRNELEAFPGPAVFELYIENPIYNQLLVGNRPDICDKVINKIEAKGIKSNHIDWLDLPFCDVDSFEYVKIAERINEKNPDIIWVSLGAPKQEIFMSRLLPYLNRGVMFGIGAAVNFYVGHLNIPKIQMGALSFVWVSRVLHEPRKQIKRLMRVFTVYPALIYHEVKTRKR